MSALLSGNDRLAELLAGSTAILSSSSTEMSPVSMLPPGLLGTDTIDTQPAADMAADYGTTPSVLTLLTGDANGGTGNSESGPLDGILSDPTGALGSISSLGSVIGLGNIGSSSTGTTGDTSPLEIAGSGTPLQPLFEGVNSLIRDFHSDLRNAGAEAGLFETVHGVTTLGDIIGVGNIGATSAGGGNHNLVTDILNAPGDVLNGDLGGVINNIGSDLTNIFDSVNHVANSVIFGVDPSNPIPGILEGVLEDIHHVPLLTVNGGNNADDGGLLGGIVGDLTHSSTGHLIDADIGPEQNNGQAIDLLSAPTSGQHHTIEVNAVDVGANGPHLADLGLLTGTSGLALPSLFTVPALGGAGTDGLAGNLLGGSGTGGLVGNLLGGTIASGNTTSAPIDISAVHDVISAPAATDHGLLDLHGTHII
jgi:hypothetical protein